VEPEPNALPLLATAGEPNALPPPKAGTPPMPDD
jgi:hypothetical protein